jgi:hypothetical protein
MQENPGRVTRFRGCTALAAEISCIWHGWGRTDDPARAPHIPGEPLIVAKVWDAVTARIVAGAPGVKALATASHDDAIERANSHLGPDELGFKY